MCRKTSKKSIRFFKDMSYLHTCSQESLINSCKLTVCHLIRWWGGCQCVRGTYWFEASVDETAQRVHGGPSERKRRLHVWPARNCQLARCVELMSTTCTEFDFFHIWIVSRNSTAAKQVWRTCSWFDHQFALWRFRSIQKSHWAPWAAVYWHHFT